MATIARPTSLSEQTDFLAGTPRAGTVDRWIYVFTAASLIAITLIGFIPDSADKIGAVAAGRRPPFPLVLHLHAVLMGSYLLLLLAQTWLAATGKIGWHARLGIATLVIVPALVVVGFLLVPIIYQETVQLAQLAPPGAKAKLDAAVVRKENILLNQIRMGILFPLFIAMGLIARRIDPGFHKRLMILGTAVVMEPAIVRINWLPTTFPASPLSTNLYILLAIAPMVVWDVARNGYVHKAYLVWLAITLPFVLVTHLLWDTPWWHETARMLMS